MPYHIWENTALLFVFLQNFREWGIDTQNLIALHAKKCGMCNLQTEQTQKFKNREKSDTIHAIKDYTF